MMAMVVDLSCPSSPALSELAAYRKITGTVMFLTATGNIVKSVGQKPKGRCTGWCREGKKLI
jgi:hypothetical protein